MLASDEKRLIKKVKKGNQAAFKKLYEFYADYALRTVYMITQNRNHTADIVQETFIKVYRHISSFDQKKPFKPWLYQILLNESRRYMRHQNKQAIAIESEELLNHLHERQPQPATYDDLAYGLDQLSEIHRTVLTLKYMNDFSEKEISSLLELNQNTVKSRLFKARKKLNEYISGGEQHE